MRKSSFRSSPLCSLVKTQNRGTKINREDIALQLSAPHNDKVGTLYAVESSKMLYHAVTDLGPHSSL